MAQVEAGIHQGLQEGAYEKRFDPRITTEALRLPELPDPTQEVEFADVVNLHLVYQQLAKADRDFIDLLESGDPEVAKILNPIAFEVTSYEQRILKRRGEIYSDENRSKGQIIADRYAQAEMYRDYGMDVWVKARIKAFNGKYVVASDVDKTITLGEEHLAFIPGSVLAENLLRHPKNGREAFFVAYVRYWRDAMYHFKDQTERLGETIPFRKGAEDFFHRLAREGKPAKLISANFKPIIEGVRRHLEEGLGPGECAVAEVCAVDEEDFYVVDKGTEVFKTVLEHPDEALFYFGDGPSDLPVLDDPEARKLVACYFALEGSEFHKMLKELHLPYYTYKTFDDITNVFIHLGLFKEAPTVVYAQTA